MSLEWNLQDVTVYHGGGIALFKSTKIVSSAGVFHFLVSQGCGVWLLGKKKRGRLIDGGHHISTALTPITSKQQVLSQIIVFVGHIICI